MAERAAAALRRDSMCRLTGSMAARFDPRLSPQAKTAQGRYGEYRINRSLLTFFG
jgi:hypothetical protein